MRSRTLPHARFPEEKAASKRTAPPRLRRWGVIARLRNFAVHLFRGGESQIAMEYKGEEVIHDEEWTKLPKTSARSRSRRMTRPCSGGGSHGEDGPRAAVTTIGPMRRSLRERVRNPFEWVCNCDQSCWCNTTRWATGSCSTSPRASTASRPSNSGRERLSNPLRRLEHFKEGGDAIERDLARAPDDVRKRFRWVPIGTQVEIAA